MVIFDCLHGIGRTGCRNSFATALCSTGWLSFSDVVSSDYVALIRDTTLPERTRIEIVCSKVGREMFTILLQLVIYKNSSLKVRHCGINDYLGI